MRSAPFGRAKYASSFAKSAIGTVRRNPLRGEEAERRRNRLSGCQHVQRASQALHRVGPAKAKASTDLDAPFCSEEDVGRFWRWEFLSV